MLKLELINEDNYSSCINIKSSVENNDYVDDVVYSIAEAYLYKDESECFAINRDGEVVGFISIYYGEDNYQIINFVIDEVHRGRGYGSEAARLCIDYFKREFNAKRVSLPVHVNNKRAQKFWMKLGFKMSDTIEDDYVFMRIYYEWYLYG